MPSGAIGSIDWVDLTVPAAGSLRDFYQQVTGWKHQDVAMGGYADFCMQEPAAGTSVAGICHAQGVNQGLPPVWLIYIRVENLDASMQRCVELGGKVIREPAGFGPGMRHTVIQDPAGAFCSLYEKTGVSE